MSFWLSILSTSLHSDQERDFESNIFQEISNLLEIRKTGTSRNPRCNGITERFNSTLLAMIRAYIKGQQFNWNLNLGRLAGAYRATPNESTTITSNMIMPGCEVRLPHEMVESKINSKISLLTGNLWWVFEPDCRNLMKWPGLIYIRQQRLENGDILSKLALTTSELGLGMVGQWNMRNRSVSQATNSFCWTICGGW